jgi:GT2 family glycosyltransferase
MHESTSPSTRPDTHAAAAGKFLTAGGARFIVRGVAYGTFAPRRDRHQFPEPDEVARDFALMARAGVNTVRTYTPPPPDVLDAAARNGLRVMAGIAWPQHIAFLDDRQLRRRILAGIAADARALARHPAVLLTAIGNEIPPAVVRWHGRRHVERFIREAFDSARAAAPDALFTYVNYPPTEFLELPFLDVHAFNVYLHDEAALRAYVARLQHAAGNRPLLLAECGADSQRHGEDGQAALTAMQLRVAYSEGACGAVAFSWTDEWWRGGGFVDDWSFGLVDRERRPKAAFASVGGVFRSLDASPSAATPTVSVVVCAYNAASTIGDCLDALDRVDYPAAEIIVVDDGSTDATAAIARTHPRARLIQIPNGGLSVARNVGMHAAGGEILVYVDADVRVEPSWLSYLVRPFADPAIVAAGGPNVVPADDSWFAQCVARAPGAPSHVMLDDRIAEHVPGCNLAVRREALLAIGGFDPIYLRAGDDVDVCWRLQDRGGLIGFAPAALVWHHHRGSLNAYARQQVGYGEGEAWLAVRHRHRFSRSGVRWHGRIYSPLPFVQSLTARRLHSGVWGTAAFPTVYHTGAHPLRALPHTASWQLGAVLLLLTGLVLLAFPAIHVVALGAIGAGAAAIATTVVKCLTYAWRSDVERLPLVPGHGRTASTRIYRVTIAALHIVQPLARAQGYLRGMWHPPVVPAAAPRERPATAEPPPEAALPVVPLVLGKPAVWRYWSEAWVNADALLNRMVQRLRVMRVGRGIEIDDGWRADRDISIAVGRWAWAHVQALVEEHGTGRCLFRARVQVRPRLSAALLVGAAAAAAALALRYDWTLIAAALGATLLALLARAIHLTIRDVRQLAAAITDVAREHAMLRLDRSPLPPAQPVSTAWRPADLTHGG